MKKIDSICIIDDDPITVFGMQKMLSLAVDCPQVESFVNGKTAIEEIKKNFKNTGKLPEVIFLDLNMPIMDGWQFLDEFVKIPTSEKIRVNIITSSIDRHDKEKWKLYQKKTHHVIDYNEKPLYKAEVARITKKA
ncbi:response regulator [Euzebyella saccharophila]|uniref:Two-component system response regulator n=1 Tax=Euzebyella saccharophila TaxID=679664 RepID=A0ABV8JT62_9FLAO|nr:response regulator [Euzebyella saccharophila]